MLDKPQLVPREQIHLSEDAIRVAEERAGHPLRSITDENGRVAKQVIVLRNKYPDGNGGTRKLRTGKLCSATAHAAVAAYKLGQKLVLHSNEDAYQAFRAWDDGAFTKITLYVDTDEELVAIYNQAQAAGLLSVIITDAGHTEFHGVPTRTAVAIGPVWEDKLEPITGHLKLL